MARAHAVFIYETKKDGIPNEDGGYDQALDSSRDEYHGPGYIGMISMWCSGLDYRVSQEDVKISFATEFNRKVKANKNWFSFLAN
jgi:hypothetical protein